MIRNGFGHAAIILSGMILVLLIIDSINPAMTFINNNITKNLLWILCVISIFNAVAYVIKLKTKKNNNMQRRDNPPRQYK